MIRVVVRLALYSYSYPIPDVEQGSVVGAEEEEEATVPVLLEGELDRALYYRLYRRLSRVVLSSRLSRLSRRLIRR